MATAARPLAKCILRWIYEQIHEVLEKLKALLLRMIDAADAQIALLRAWLAQWDVLAKAEEFLWEQVQKIIEEIKNQLLSIVDGPDGAFCPEFYQYFLGPAYQLFDASVSGLTVFRERYHNMLSYMDEVDGLIDYWDQWKTDLVAAVEILDDAILIQTQELAEEVP